MQQIQLSNITTIFYDTQEIFSQHQIIWGNYPGQRKPYTHSRVFWNHPNGVRSAEGQFTGGVRSGLWRWYGEDGSLTKETDFGRAEYVKQPTPPEFDVSCCTPDNTILLDEEDGYKLYLWLPCWLLEETVEWWRNLDGICQFVSSNFLPGIKIELLDDDAYEVWKRLRDAGCYIGHLNEDYDSGLISPSGELIQHKNYELSRSCIRLGPELVETASILDLQKGDAA